MARILFVEDDEFVRELVLAQLFESGHRVLAVEQADAALRAIDDGEPVDVLMTDVMLPGPMDGYALSRAVRARRPGLPVLYASGGAAPHAGDGAVDDSVRHLRKPFRLQQVARAIDELLASAGEH